jgi:succinoglycan biosynthesis protein ExoL
MAKNKEEIIFLIQAFEQPRILKKIIEKSFEYKQVKVYGFTRKIHAVNNYSLLDDYDNIEYKILGEFTDKKYFNRLFYYIKLLWVIFKNHGFKKKLLYVVGIDLRMISTLVFNAKIDYVISDIVWLYYPKLQRAVFRVIDTQLAKRSRKVLFTSRGFYESHYAKYVTEEQVEITENKLATYGKVKPLDKIKNDTIRIAYIGAFRYTNIIENLLKTVINNDKLILNFYGDGFSEIVTLVKDSAAKYSNISFNGAFKNPDDLERIYQENNLNFVVYNNLLENERVAMPNKYYESGYMNIPILCATNTYVGKRAVDLGMGWMVDIDQISIANFFENLKMTDLEECHQRIKLLDKDLFSC